jgi:hypothetical protein
LYLLRPYYLVALCTCFEWHAKARVRDFIEYYAESVRDDMEFLKGRELSSHFLLEGLRGDSTIGEIVAAPIKVNSIEQYVAIIEQCFRLGEITISLGSLLTDISKKYLDESNSFADLFRSRHTLVHEMSRTQFSALLGPVLYVSDLKTLANASRELFKAIERSILDLPADFPNKMYWLFSDITPTDEDALTGKITRLENLIANELEENDRSRFREICKNWREYYRSEEHENSSYVPHIRHFSEREFFLEKICRERIRYLRKIFVTYFEDEKQIQL